MSINRREFFKRAGVGVALLSGGSGMLYGRTFAMNPARFQANSDVSFVGSSSAGTRRKMIKDVLEPWKETVAAGIAGKTVLIKVNMVFWNTLIADPMLSLTHVDAVRGLIDFLRSISSSVPIIVGDCTANATENGTITNIFTKAGYDALKTEYSSVTLQDLNTLPSVDRHFWTPAFSASDSVVIPVINAFMDPEYYIISICRPKTHSNMVITGINKNILMGAPLHSNGTADGVNVVIKQYMHGQNGWYDGKHLDENKCLSYNIFQMANLIYSTGAPALSVLDAWEGMEGNGPASGKSIMQYCAVAGIDPLAVDRLAAKLMGFSDTATDPMNKATPSYTDMRVLVWISNAGFGNYDLSKINFILGSLDALNGHVKSYTLHSNYTGTAKDSTSYETEWTGGPPPTIFDTGVKDSRYLDPKPYLAPQIHKAISTNEVKIDFSLPVSFKVHVGIYNMQGVEVRRLGYESLPGGRYSVVWNRHDDTGSRVPAGNYVIKLGFGSRSLCDQIALVK
jgi:uncharacterized protein (DUF362 family)